MILQEDWVLCRVFQKTKGDGDGQDSAGGASSPTLTGSSHVMPDQDHHDSCGYYGSGFVPQQEVAVMTTDREMLPYYSTADGFSRDDSGSALPAFEFGASGVAAGEYAAFGYFDMAGVEDMASHGIGGVGFPQGWY